MFDFDNYSKFESIEEIYNNLKIMGWEYDLSYNGNELMIILQKLKNKTLIGIM